ncbi:transcription termination factor MTERF5, chloroplastic [Abrus precatorius]|uniref:Transcription termination factor MTERF5, chloroplastic n=1 Tax=Abrus precatorius TaxID=3816 RepID=A0A8B8KK14_ABRPR|nr:transcription termination factor MTERF5, chloroplastic [Abrus precatorius]
MQNRTFEFRHLMQFLKLHPPLLCPLNNLFSYSCLNHLFLSPFSTSSLSTQRRRSKVDTLLIDYLNAKFKFSRNQSIFISKHVSGHSFPQKPLSVLSFFEQIGFSETQILSMIRQKPQILFSDVDKTLRPKIKHLQLLGFEASDLCNFISNNSTLLTSSLKKSLVPSVEAIRKIVCNENDFIHVLHRCGWILPKYQKFMDNVIFLQSCGIVGSQLSMLLKQQSRLFVAPQSTIRKHVSRAVDMGFDENSRMLVHAIHTISGLSYKTFGRKLELINCFGFSKDESLQMFKRSPSLLRTSEKKLKVGLEFFLHTVMLPKLVLVRRPMILMYSMEDRILPRYRVWQLIISRKLCKKVPSYINVLYLSEEEFLYKYITRFRENAVELLVAYKGHHLET